MDALHVLGPPQLPHSHLPRFLAQAHHFRLCALQEYLYRILLLDVPKSSKFHQRLFML